MPRQRFWRRRPWPTAGAALVLAYLLSCGLVYLLGPSGDTVQYGARDYAAVFGIVDGQSYPSASTGEAGPSARPIHLDPHAGNDYGDGQNWALTIEYTERGRAHLITLDYTTQVRVIHTAPGEQPSVTFRLHQSLPAYSGYDGPHRVQPGNFWLWQSGAVVAPPDITRSSMWRDTVSRGGPGELMPKLVDVAEVRVPAGTLDSLIRA
ncbi:hypothetical protein JNJ66_05405 [Candidatus Saccharibacteria bacterium]|nr:hypothetical protein [Candidatus Saccharibacteria bacterium]